MTMPPHNLEVERALLGAMLLTAEATSIARPLLTAGRFYKPAHQEIFAAICRLADKNIDVDAVSVADEVLAGTNGASSADLMGMMAGTPAATNAEHYALMVRRDGLRRDMIAAGHELAKQGYESKSSDGAEILDQIEAMLFKLTEGNDTGTESLHDIMPRVLDDIEARYETDDGTVFGTSTGLVDVDAKVGGLEPGTLSLIGARPAMGKSALALSIGLEVASSGLPVVLYSLEMSKLELGRRMNAMRASVPLTDLNRGDMPSDQWAKLAHGMGKLSDMPFHLNDDGGMTTLGMRSDMRRIRLRHGQIGLVIVDYVQLMTPANEGENRQQDISKISRDLKRLAGDFNCPVLALSQLSRGLESRTDRRPMLQDLRESGALEQDADAVMFLYRDEIYNPDTADRDQAELIIAKNRSGPTGRVLLRWEPKFVRFSSLSLRRVEPQPTQQAAF